MFRPDFIHTDEEWCIWLLSSEFNGHASPVQLHERTRLSMDQVLIVIRCLEQMKAVRVVTIPGKFPPDNIKLIRLQKPGSDIYEELIERNR